MAQTLALLAPTAAAGNSADIVVQGTPVTVYAYSADGSFPNGAVSFTISRKIGANYVLERTAGGSDGRAVVLYGPGTYRLSKLATTDVWGFGKDDAT